MMRQPCGSGRSQAFHNSLSLLDGSKRPNGGQKWSSCAGNGTRAALAMAQCREHFCRHRLACGLALVSTKKPDVTSIDVNDYLKEIIGKDITAKDFRTWAGTVLTAMALNELESFDSAAQAKRNLRAAIEKVCARLGNTPTLCRKCYVHPEVLNYYMDGNLVLELKSKAESELRSGMGSLKSEEAAVLALLRSRLAK